MSMFVRCLLYLVFPFFFSFCSFSRFQMNVCAFLSLSRGWMAAVWWKVIHVLNVRKVAAIEAFSGCFDGCLNIEKKRGSRERAENQMKIVQIFLSVYKWSLSHRRRRFGWCYFVSSECGCVIAEGRRKSFILMFSSMLFRCLFKDRKEGEKERDK